MTFVEPWLSSETDPTSPHRHSGRRLPSRSSDLVGVASGADNARSPYRTDIARRTVPFATTRDRASRHRAVGDAATAQVAVTADQDAVRTANVTTVLIKRCRTVLTERCRYITK
jgi:hypothetical protein